MNRAIGSILRAALIGIIVGISASALYTTADIFRELAIEPTVFDYVGERTYKMVNPENHKSGGTGFAVQAASGKTYMLTNAHVCRVTEEPYLYAMQGERGVRLPILDISESTDLCILDTAPGQEGITLAASAGSGTQAYLVGHPHLQPLTLKIGYLAQQENVLINYCMGIGSSTSTEEFFVQPYSTLQPLQFEALFNDCVKAIHSQVATLESRPGNSGSAVTNREGELIGVLFAGNGTGGLSLLVPLEDVRDFLSIY